jgi:hypothetical protein
VSYVISDHCRDKKLVSRNKNDNKTIRGAGKGKRRD